jgi:hypothetical protein
MRTMGAMLAALVVAGCAGNALGETPGGGSGDALRVVVQNDGTIPTQVRVYLVPAGGAEINLGTMGTLGTETLTARGPLISGQYRLRAEGGTGYTLTSPIVQLRRGDTIVWDMRRNLVQRQQR